MNIDKIDVMEYFDTFVTNEIMQKYGYSELESLEKFIGSQTYELLLNQDLALTSESHLFIFDMWEAEQITGNPRNSRYIREMI